MRWNIYVGNKLIAKALDAELAVSIATSGMLSAFPIYIKKEGRVALKLVSEAEQYLAGVSYDRTVDRMISNLRDAADKSRRAIDARCARADARNAARSEAEEAAR